jgi:hypothetical protein
MVPAVIPGAIDGPCFAGGAIVGTGVWLPLGGGSSRGQTESANVWTIGSKTAVATPCRHGDTNACHGPFKSGEALGVQLCSNHGRHDCQGLDKRHGRPIGSLGGQRIEDICRSDDPRFQDNPIISPARIVFAVKPLMMRSRNCREVAECRKARQNRCCVSSVHWHRRPLVQITLAQLVEDRVADT